MVKTILSAVVIAVSASAVLISGPVMAKATDYKATVQTKKINKGRKKAKGFVFEDINRNGKFNRGEPGIPNVMVSNGKEVVMTNKRGK